MTPPSVSSERARAEARLRERLAETAERGLERPDAVSGPSPLSAAQERLWLLQQLDPASPSVHRPLALKLTGTLDDATLRRCLDVIVERHAVLRTAYRQDDAGVKQHVLPHGRMPFDIDDARGTSAAEAQSRLVAEARRPFDLQTGPMARALLQQRSHDVHVLLLLFHHIAFDGWSAEILIAELSALYRTYSQGLPPDLPPLPIQYIDFARWEQEQWRRDAFDEQIDYWRRQLADLPTLKLETDYRRPEGALVEGARHVFKLSSRSLMGARQLARDEQTTLFTVLLAAFQAWLHRHTGQSDLGVGVPVAGRSHPDAEPLIGCFINLLVLRAGVSGELTVRDLVRRTGKTSLDAQAHQDVSFGKVVEALQPRRQVNRAPLAQALFQLRNLPKSHVPSTDGLEIEPFPFDPGFIGGHELALELEETPDGLQGAFVYSSDLFAPASIACFAEHFEVLLEAAVAAPDTPISELPLMSEAERQRLLIDFHDTAQDFPADLCLHELVEMQAERTPDAIALACGKTNLSYAALDQRANQLAHVLKERGVGPEVLVGLGLERSFDMVAGLLGVLKAGGAFLPLDLSLPAARLRFILDDAQPALILTQRDLASQLPADAVPLCFAESADDETPTTRVAGGASPDHLAYVLYTSGSTGRPKGVMIEHRSVRNHMQWYQFRWPLPSDAIGLFHSPLTFDMGIVELFAPLIGGSRLILPEPEREGDPVYLARLILAHRVTQVHAVPSLLRAWLEDVELTHYQGIRRFLTGGEAVPLDLAERVTSIFDAQVLNGYGPTETAIDATAWLCVPGDPHRSVSIGRPIDNVQVYVLDDDMNLTAQGLPGELYIGGIQVARGYLNRPELTAERFLPDPFSDTPGARLYRTGDVVRWRYDGALEFLGRVDHQVKLRGQRIELGEIEAVLQQHPAVRACVVTVWEPAANDQRLVAYVVGGADPSHLEAHLKTYLPGYMVPSHFEALSELPLLPSGKTDRHALPSPSPLPRHPHGFEPPQTPTEQALARIWSDLLQVGQVSRTDDFFALGGHSLLATRLIWRLRKHFACDLPLVAFFEISTIAELADMIDEATDAVEERQDLIPHVADGAPTVLSSAQQRLWFIDQLEGSSALYNVQAAVRLRGPLDVAALQRALDASVERHAVLRTTFEATPDGPLQIVQPARRVPLDVHDVRDRPAEERESHGIDRLTEAAQQPFDLTADLMLRGRLVRLADADHLLGLTLHHIASDGWSLDILWRELSELYTTFSERREPTLPPLPIQYADYAVWQCEQLARPEMDAQLDYWRQQLTGIEPLHLPTDRPRPPVQSHRGASHLHNLPASLVKRLETLAQRERVTPFMVLLAAYKALLHRYTGQTDVSVGSPIAGRNRGELEPLIGFFVNSLILRTKVSGELSFQALLGRVRKTALTAYDHQDVPFDQIVEALNPPRDRSRSPLFQTMFVLQNQPRYTQQWNDLTAQQLLTESGHARFDLTVHALPLDDRLHLRFTYATDLFDRATIERFAGHFELLLEAIVEAPATPLWQLPMMGETERRRLLVDFNDTEQEFPLDVCLHELFEEQVDRAPDAVALTFEEHELTYAALERRANQLAHELRERGVGPDVLVGVCLERSFEMVVGLLAILKAGGAYVPLDPTLPEARLRFLLEDAQPALILTQRHLAAQLPATTIPQCFANDARDGAPTTRVPRTVRPHNLAYVLFTSGSTGQPKGVMIEHRAICNRLQWQQALYPRDAADAGLMRIPLGFDQSVAELFATLQSGGRVVIPQQEREKDPPYLIDLIVRHGVTTLHLVPTMLRMLIGNPGFETCRSLRRIFSGGEALTVELQRRVQDALNVELVNWYGPTETAVDASHGVGMLDETSAYVPIGRPAPNVRLYVCDHWMQPAPIGIPGELYVGGIQLARGYLNRPELTAERFVADPFSDAPGARLYRTGDLARWRTDGTLEFIGRVDHQVKLRGYRIELGEIEAVLQRHPGVRACVVTLREAAPGDQRIVAYFVGDAEVALLRAHLKTYLPDAMVPSHFEALKELPRLPNGKIDRHALPAPSASKNERHDCEPPETPTEQVLADIWSELLQVEHIGRHDDFFELGGHSLLATQVIWRISQRLGCNLSLASFFDAPELAELASAIDQEMTATRAAPRADRIPRREHAGPTVLSSEQQRLWFIDQLEPESFLYNLPATLRLVGSLDEEVLRTALDALVERHAALRTTFHATPDGPRQEVHPPHPVEFDICDVRDEPPGGRFDAAIDLLAEHTRRHFDLTADLLLRARAVRVAEDEYLLRLTVHHISSDGWSIGILRRELAEFYTALIEQRAPAIAPLPIEYADYAAWQRKRLASPKMAAQLDYWTRQLDGIQPFELPTDRPRPPVQSHRGASYAHRLSARLVGALEHLARREHTTLFMVLLAAYKTLLHRYTGQTDMSVGSPIAGRNHGDLESLVGFFVNSLVLRTHVSPELSFQTLLGRVRDVALAAYDHQDVPFDQIVEALNPPRDRSRAPLFQTSFALHNLPPRVPRWSGLRAERLFPGAHAARFDLTTHALPLEDGLHLRFTYATDLFDPATIERFADHFEALLEAIVEAPAVRIFQLPMMSDDLSVELINETLLKGATRHPMAAPSTSSQRARAETRLRNRLAETANLGPERLHRGSGPAPLSAAQERLWLLQQLEPASPGFHRPLALRLTGALDDAALQRCLDVIVERHAVLRTVYRQDDDGVKQYVLPPAGMPFDVDDARGTSAAEAQSRLIAEARRPFDLQAGPMARAVLQQRDDDLYVLLLLFHHIAFDGWSVDVLVGELSALYRTYSQGRPPDLPPLPIQYAAFACWQREQARGAAFDEQLEYWRRQLADIPTLKLQTDYRRPEGTLVEGAQHTFALSSRSLMRARQLAHDEQTTLFTVLLATFQAWLYRHTGQPDLGIHVPVAGRTHPDTEPLIGCFINLLVLRADVAGELTIRDLVRRAGRTALEAQARQDVPFTQIVEALQRRQINRTPLAQALFQLRHLPKSHVVPADGLEIEPFPFDPGFIGGHDLALELQETQDGLQGTFAYSSDLFAPASIACFAEHFEILFEAALTAPDTPVAELPLMSETERRRLLIEFNDTAQDFPGDVCLHELFEAQAARTPDAVALVCGEHNVSYAALERRANQLAHVLKERGVGPEVLVGLSLERSVDLVAGVLGVLKAGGAFLPLDLSLPEARLRFILDDAQPALVLTQRQLAAALPAGSVPLCFAGSADDETPTTRVAGGASPDHLAYVLYTSGSTGRPKGVMIEHRSVRNHMQWYQFRWPLRSDAIGLFHCPLTFDMGIVELFAPLLAGSRLILPEPGREGDPIYLVRLIKDNQVREVHAVPSLLRAWLEDGEFVKYQGLQRVFTGGEVLPLELAERLMSGLGIQVLNGYGPTETAIDATAWPCEPGDPHRSVAIGRPLDNVQVYVLDEHGDLAPQGLPGELYIGGVQVARGYLNRPELTAERFLPDPFSGTPGTRLYRTGDLVRWRYDGALEFLGRIDHQVKLRGQRIELGEIEAVLQQHPAVCACVVAVWEPAANDQRLVAYVVGEADASHLESHLKTYLPDYMVPSHFEALSELPLMPSGKVDRHALPAPSPAPHDPRGFEPPQTPTEQALARIWADLLQAEQVGRADDFFALGGHSLLATQLIWRLREHFVADLPLAAIFEYSTLAELAELIDEPIGAVEDDQDGIPRVPDSIRAVLSSAQQRLWFIDRLEPGSSLYNVPAQLRLRGPLDVEALQKALDALLERHTVLRTTFQATADGPLQTVEPSRPLPLEGRDVRDRPAAQRETDGIALLSEAARQPFDLTTDLMLRACLVRLADDEHLLGLTLHHIASDGWSIGILWRELAELYAAFSERREPTLPPLPIQYAEYAVSEREQLAGPEMAAQLDYWKRQLAGVEPLQLPTDRPRPPVQSHRGASHTHDLPAPLVERLKALARRERTTLFMVLLAGYKALLHRYTGQTDISIGSPIAGRNRSELEPLIGFFVNSLVLRTQVSPELSFQALLARVRETAITAYDHQDVPFDQIVEALNPPRDRSRTPLFQTMFTLQNQPRHTQQWEDLEAETLLLGGRTAKFDLSTAVLPRDESLRLHFNYAIDLFDHATIERFAGHFETLLEAVTAAPDKSLAQVSIMSEAERAAFDRWNDTRQSLPEERRVHRLFEQRAQQTPDAPAVSDGTTFWTYAELDRHANRLARTILTLAKDRATGEPGALRIGLHVTRSAGMVAGMLGALKAGGAYVPLDSDSPVARLQTMLADAELTAIVTDADAELEDLAVPVLNLPDDPLAGDAEQLDPAEPANGAAGDAPAYVMYTSGSTGQPKGVVVPHHAVVHLVCNTDYVTLDSQDVVAQAANSAFDATTFEVWGALLNGARLVILPREALLSPPQLARTLRTEGVTTLFLTTALFNLVVQETPQAFGSLRTLLFGGQRVEPRWVRAVLDSDPPERLLHVYGPTETTTFASWHEIRDIDEDATNIPIGKPLAGTTLRVLDDAMQPVPIGVEGELHIGGLGVALGYLNRSSLTAERFLPDPFADDASARLYRTGDRVRRLATGEILFVGRRDRQLKLRGFRIEPGEIEVALGSHPAVRQAFVRPYDAAADRLVAYAEVPGVAVSADLEAALREHLRQRLPEYMVPAAIVTLDELPLTANGKIDDRRLPEPRASSTDSAPRDDLEALLQRLWMDVLHTDRVGVNDDFFALGGHSLMAAQLFTRLESHLGLRLPLALLFEAPSISALAAAIRSRDWERSWSSIVQLEPPPRPNAPTFFCIHDAGGNVLNQRNLAERLRDTCAYVGVQAAGLDGEQPPLRCVGEMAERYLREVRRVQPHGPYVFGGFSFGGVVAYEMARRVQQAGEEMGLLILLDAGVPPNVLSVPKRVSYRGLSHLKRLGGRLLRRREVQDRAQTVKRQLLAREGRLDDPSPAAAQAFWEAHRRMMQASREAMRAYEPKPYRGPAVLVRMKRKARYFPKLHNYVRSMLRWEMIISDLEVFELEGRHLMLIEAPCVDRIAAFLRSRLVGGNSEVR